MLLPTMLNAVKIGKKTLVINMMTKVSGLTEKIQIIPTRF